MKGIRTMRELVKLVLILMMAISMSACSKTTWKEEVLLHDGSKIVVERTVSRGGLHEIGSSPPIETQSIKFSLPATNQTIVWQDRYSDEVGSASFNVLALNIFDGIPYVVTSAYGCLAYNKWGRPNPPYVIFKFVDKSWKRIPIAELPPELRDINLVIDTSNNEKELGEFISVERVKNLNSDYKQPEYKTILREPIIKEGPEGCPEMIYKGHGGWISRDLFTAQPSYAACLRACTTEGMQDEICPCNSIFTRK